MSRRIPLMPPSAESFEAERPHLVSVAYRMLGSVAEAQDVVQEAWLRYTRAGDEEIRDLRGWLTTVTGRLCLDVLNRPACRARPTRASGCPTISWTPTPARPVRPSGATRSAWRCSSSSNG